MKTNKYLSGCIFGALVLFSAACGGGGGGEQVDAALASAGQQVFTQKGLCYTCHGQNAEGTALAPNLTDNEWINIEGEITQASIANIVRTGVAQPKQHPAPMPPMGGATLTDEEVQSVSAYVYSLSHQ